MVAKEGQTIYYLDVTSLYPSQMFFQQFPIGEPQFLDEFTPEQVATVPFRGFVKASILPPTNLKKPILPYRCAGRLVFPLCSKCSEQDNKNLCTHTDEERTLVSCKMNKWRTKL